MHRNRYHSPPTAQLLPSKSDLEVIFSHTSSTTKSDKSQRETEIDSLVQEVQKLEAEVDHHVFATGEIGCTAGELLSELRQLRKKAVRLNQTAIDEGTAAENAERKALEAVKQADLSEAKAKKRLETAKVVRMETEIDFQRGMAVETKLFKSAAYKVRNLPQLHKTDGKFNLNGEEMEKVVTKTSGRVHDGYIL